MPKCSWCLKQVKRVTSFYLDITVKPLPSFSIENKTNNMLGITPAMRGGASFPTRRKGDLKICPACNRRIKKHIKEAKQKKTTT